VKRPTANGKAGQRSVGRGLFPTDASGPNRGGRVSSAEIACRQQLDRANLKIDVGYGCVAAHCGLGLIGNPNFHGAGRPKDRRNDLTCSARTRTTASMLALNTNSPMEGPARAGEADPPTTSQHRHVCTTARLQPVTRVPGCQIAAKGRDEGGQSSVEL
jgi:hypothetical protein